MVLASHSLSFTASDLGTFEDCEARFYHSQQRYRDGLLPTDRNAAEVSSAVHDALMELHRQLERSYQRDLRPSLPAIRERLRTLVEKALVRKRVHRSIPAAAERLAKLDAALDLVAELVWSDMPGWTIDRGRGELLVWVEAPLNHGPAIPAVQLSEGYLVRTRPDVIGMRPVDSGMARVVVRDYKARSDAIDPVFDTGILVRALWALAEIRNPRCPWFLAGRDLQVDPNVIDLETVNLLHAGSAEFRVQASLTEADLLAHRNRLMTEMVNMAAVVAARDADDVSASPGSFCLSWCPFLPKCGAGLAHVRKYQGDDVVSGRLGDR